MERSSTALLILQPTYSQYGDGQRSCLSELAALCVSAGFPELGGHATTALALTALSWLARERAADNVKFNYLNRNLMVSTFGTRSLYFISVFERPNH